MVKKIIILDNFKFIDLIKNFRVKRKIYYLKKSFLINFFEQIFLNLKNLKTKWNLIDNTINDKKIITSIIENYEVDKFVYEFLDELEQNIKIEKISIIILLSILAIIKI